MSVILTFMIAIATFLDHGARGGIIFLSYYKRLCDIGFVVPVPKAFRMVWTGPSQHHAV